MINKKPKISSKNFLIDTGGISSLALQKKISMATKPKLQCRPVDRRSKQKANDLPDPIKCDCGKMMYPEHTDGKITWFCEDDDCGGRYDSLGNGWNAYC